MRTSFLRQQLLIVTATVITVSTMVLFNAVLAAPTQNPPAGNPAFPLGPTGAQGPQGPQGGQGGQGPTGYTGSQGQQGPTGSANCSWNNTMFLNNGWDWGWGQGLRGVYIYCSGGQTYSFWRTEGVPPIA